MDNRSFAEAIVSRLGTPKEPFVLEDTLLLGVLAIAVGAYVAVELGLARFIRRLFRTGR